MPSRRACLLLALAMLSILGILAPGRARAEITADQRARIIREIKRAMAVRNNEGLEKVREREAERSRDHEEREREERRFAAEAGITRWPDLAEGERQEPQPQGAPRHERGFGLDVPTWVSLRDGSSSWPVPATAPRDASRAGGAVATRQRPVPPEAVAEAGGGGRAATPSARVSRGALGTEASQAFATNVRVSDPALDNPSRGDAQSETAIAAWKNYMLAAWNESRATGHSPIGVAWSTNSGQTFTSGGQPNEGSNDVVWTSDPVVTVNERTGEFYFCSLADPVDDGSIGITHGVAVVRGTFTGSTFTWDLPRVVNSCQEFNTGAGQTEFIDKPWVAVDSLSGNLYVTYTRYAGGVDSIWVQRSTNKGVTWSTPVALSLAPGQFVQGARVSVGPAGEVYAIWKEISLTSPNGEDYFRISKSTNFGVSWTTEQIAVALFDNFGGGAPGFNRELGISFPSIVVDRTNGPNRGRVHLAWNDCVNFWDQFPADTAANQITESEINDTTFTADAFTPGQTLLGTYSNAEDWDYWGFDATQGTTYIFWCTSSTLFTMRIFCTDNSTRLAFSGDRFGNPFNPAPGVIVWTAPTSGRYYLRIANVDVDAITGRYIVGTAVDAASPGTERARDHRDVFTLSSPNGLDWSATPVRVNTDAARFDNWLPEIAVSEGALFTAWFDFSGAGATTCAGESHVNMARSNDGGATWNPLGAVTDQVTNWTLVNSDIIPNQGDYIALFANRTTIVPSWADGRCPGGCVATPDDMAAPFIVNGLRVAVTSVVTDTNHVAISWQVSGTTIPDAQLYRRTGTGAYAAIASLTPDGSGQLIHDDVTVAPATQYSYRLGILVNGEEVLLGDQSVTTPGPQPPSLSFTGATPNPTPGGMRLTFSLATGEAAWLTLFDAAGRKLREWDVSPLGPGTHRNFDFGQGLSIEPGVYIVRLRQGGREESKRVVVIP